MWIANPFADPLFRPALYLEAALLGGVLLVLLVLARFDLRRLGQSVLFARWRVWAVIALVFTLALLGGRLPTALLLALIVLQGSREYASLVGLPPVYRRVLLALSALAVPVAALSLDAFYSLPPVLLIAATLQPLLLYRDAVGIRHLAFAALGWGYIAWLLAHVMLLYVYVDGGPGILLTVALATAASDVGAFVVGRRFGRRRLAPRLSPNKTWAGAAGNLLGAYLGIGLTAFALPDRHFWLLLATLPLVIAPAAIWGDLLESAIKREFQVKDAGAWLPGFGGLLDRVDSLIVVGPLVFYFLRLLG